MAAPSQAQKVVLAAGGLMGAAVVYRARSGLSLPAGSVYKQVWAVGVLTVILAVAADFAPSLVVPFAVAVVAGYTLVNRGELFPATAAKKQAAAKSKPSPAATYPTH